MNPSTLWSLLSVPLLMLLLLIQLTAAQCPTPDTPTWTETPTVTPTQPAMFTWRQWSPDERAGLMQLVTDYGKKTGQVIQTEAVDYAGLHQCLDKQIQPSSYPAAIELQTLLDRYMANCATALLPTPTFTPTATRTSTPTATPTATATYTPTPVPRPDGLFCAEYTVISVQGSQVPLVSALRLYPDGTAQYESTGLPLEAALKWFEGRLVPGSTDQTLASGTYSLDGNKIVVNLRQKDYTWILAGVYQKDSILITDTKQQVERPYKRCR